MSAPYRPRQLSPAASRTGDGQTTAQPTPALQRLYNRMRELEDSLTFDDRLELSTGTAAHDDEHLRPPTERSSAMSRSASHTSSYSITQGVQNVDIAGDGRDEPKPKLGRRGPLPRYSKARTAFVRKLGACSSCHQRKVKCTHLDLTAFEMAYQATGRSSQGKSPNQSSYLAPADPQPPRLDASQQAIDLRGMNTGPSPTVPANYQAFADLEILLPQPTPSAPSALPGGPVSNSSFLQEAYLSHQPLQTRDIPIGRELVDGLSVRWECHGTVGITINQDGNCHQQFSTVGELDMHFRLFHTSFRQLNPPYMYCCKTCGFFNDLPQACYQCEAGGQSFERWYYGSIQDGLIRHSEYGRVVVADGRGYPGQFFLGPPAGNPFSGSGSTDGNSGAGAGFDGKSYSGTGQRSSGWHPLEVDDAVPLEPRKSSLAEPQQRCMCPYQLVRRDQAPSNLGRDSARTAAGSSRSSSKVIVRHLRRAAAVLGSLSLVLSAEHLIVYSALGGRHRQMVDLGQVLAGHIQAVTILVVLLMAVGMWILGSFSNGRRLDRTLLRSRGHQRRVFAGA